MPTIQASASFRSLVLPRATNVQLRCPAGLVFFASLSAHQRVEPVRQDAGVSLRSRGCVQHNPRHPSVVHRRTRHAEETMATRRTRPRSSPANPLPAVFTDADYALPGSLARRYMRCGKTNCRCKADPPVLLGPQLHWTRTVAGKTQTQTLTLTLTEEQATRYQPLRSFTRNASSTSHRVRCRRSCSMRAATCARRPPCIGCCARPAVWPARSISGR